MKKLRFVYFLVTAFHSIASNTYNFDELCRQAYQDITSLKISSGQQLINKAKQQNPDN